MRAWGFESLHRHMEKSVWIYPKNNIGRLDRCHIFYGTEKEFKSFMRGFKGRTVKGIMKQAIRFSQDR